MNPDKLTFKDYIIIYFIIFLLAAFLSGFFLGARMMENQLKKTKSVVLESEGQAYTKDELIKYYFNVYSRIRAWNMDIYKTVHTNKVDKEKLDNLIKNGEALQSHIDIFTFESEFLKKSLESSQDNLVLVINSNNMKDEYDKAFSLFLDSQKNFYRSIWLWEQTQNKDKIISETLTNWEEWNKANLHQKDYIVAAILQKYSIYTFLKPEDITVHIDAYLKGDQKTELSLYDVINLLVKSEAVYDYDFTKYKSWYQDTELPGIPNFDDKK